MSDQRLQIDQTARNDSDSFWVLVRVSVQEVERDLVRGTVSEWVLSVSLYSFIVCDEVDWVEITEMVRVYPDRNIRG